MTDNPDAAGWLPDPFAPDRIRYWDGENWTDNVAAAPADPVASSAVPAEPAAAPTVATDVDLGLPVERGGHRRFLAVAAGVVVLAAAAGGAWVLLSDDNVVEAVDTTPTSVAVESSTTVEAPATTVSTTSAAPTTSVPPTTTVPPSTTAPPTTTTLPPECNDIAEVIAPSSFLDIGAMSAEATEAIAWAEAIGLVTTGDGNFRPVDSMSRAEVTTVLWRYFCGPAPTASAGFVDVPPEAFFAAPVDWAAGAGIISGTTPSTFSPGNPINRSQFVTMAWRAVGSPPGSPPAPFSDTTPGSFYSAALDWAFDVGLVSGRSATEFAPDEPLDRLTAIVLFWRVETIIDPVVT